ncbi:unnamed protein product [Trichobilharzia regenti]|nr:unnamed protein product [Trichobilharzia regenti]
MVPLQSIKHTGAAELSFHVHKISSSCIMHRYIAVGDSEGAVRVYKFQLIAGSLDGSVTVILVNEPASDYTCLYGRKCGENCGLGFMDRRDLLHHVLNEHLHFGNKKTIMCGWGAGRCRVRFTETQTIRGPPDQAVDLKSDPQDSGAASGATFPWLPVITLTREVSHSFHI